MLIDKLVEILAKMLKLPFDCDIIFGSTKFLGRIL